MKIAFCIIIKDDSELGGLKRLIKSAKGAYDTVHITANNEPYTKIQKWCMKEGHDFTFLSWNDDFSEQRNYNFSLAPKGTDYIMWADADDVIVNPHIVREVAEIAKKKGHDTIFFTYWYGSEFDGEPSMETFVQPETTHMRERLIKPGKIMWKKRIHETPVPLDGENFNQTQVKYTKKYPVAWLHLGADRDLPDELLYKRLKRNRRMLEKELEDERKIGKPDPRSILYLMKVYAESKNKDVLEKCIELGREYMQLSGWDEERAVCCRLMSTCMGKLERHREARTFLHNAIEEYPHDALLYLHLARTYFNLKNYRAMKHWMQIGMNMDLEENSGAMNDILEMKVLGAELLLKHEYFANRDIKAAHKAAKLLNKVNPQPEHEETIETLEEQVRLDDAARNAHQYMQYLEYKRQEEYVEPFIDSLPEKLRRLPISWKYYNRYKNPRIWAKNEICYFANFGQEHFEKWDGNSLKKGLGGSETAVIRLSEEWTKMGYKVTVYGDPKEPVEINGVRYLPYYFFNQRDSFNVFIQWRNNAMAGVVDCKKFIVDLHDVTHSATFMDKVDQIDAIMVKSDYHRGLLADVPDDKFVIISNGI
jgi:tetratricopeptide (TPR) repeat protein